MDWKEAAEVSFEVLSQRLSGSAKEPFETPRRLWNVDDDDDDDHHHHHVDRVRLRLWAAASNWPNFDPTGDTWAWRTVVDDIYSGKLLIRPQSYQHSHLVAKPDEWAKRARIWPCEVFFQVIFTFSKILRRGASGFTSLPKEGVVRIFIALKNPSPLPRMGPANLGSNGKHTNHYTTEETQWNVNITFDNFSVVKFCPGKNVRPIAYTYH
jgi:hypothetical protein